MGLGNSMLLFATLLLIPYFAYNFCYALDTITSTQFIKDPEVIVSNGNAFQVGFFSPPTSTNRYLGIWFSGINVTTPVWVANRDKPLNDSSGVLKISEDGNLVVLNGRKEVLWSTNVSTGGVNSSAVLTDDGHLILQDNSNGNSLWESFQHPSDTLFQKMKLTTKKKTGQMVKLTSWKSPSDPAVGNFSAGIDASGIPEGFIWKDGIPYWRTGPWVGQIFIGIFDMNNTYLSGYNLVKEADEEFSLSLTYTDFVSRFNLVLDSDGQLKEKFWDAGMGDWKYDFQSHHSECDVYGMCGEFGFCDPQKTPICSCMQGFEPRNPQEWYSGNWSSGCKRRTQLQCERLSNGNEDGKEDGFLRLQTLKVPYFAQWSDSLEQKCKEECLSNCSCLAYSYYSGFGCMTWSRELIDTQQFLYGGTDLYIRLAYSELGHKRNMKVIIIIIALIGTIAIAICAFFSWKWIARCRDKVLSSQRNGALPSDLGVYQIQTSQIKVQEVPMFNIQLLIAATDEFNESNKLGQGGFGPVYKGTLIDGKEIAVKRLSTSSGQGLEEFMNEVKVISKLQHKNLVRLLGCCVEGEEKMLVYEYMPNKSLDAFLFDQYKRETLDWRKRFSIIEGIARGLLYLHRDSRLKIIHRDLKASNVLLDQELNPKISDFGMARIFGGNEDQAKTRRVMGTYGYMSPEYAIEGRFSEKSDVFSFGVLLLEIVSGRRNTSFYDSDQALNLLGFAWNLWNEGNIATLVDPIAYDPFFQVEVSRCIHIGLLCVQELAKDRPAISIVMSMLNSEIFDLPIPKLPAFSERNFGLESQSFEKNHRTSSINNVTMSVIDGR